MSRHRDRLEVLQALAEFDRGCQAFAEGMARLNGLHPADPVLQAIIEALGPPRPAQKALPTNRMRERLRAR